jgi:LysM repeat protein
MALKIYHYPVMRGSHSVQSSWRFGGVRTLARHTKAMDPKTFGERLERANTPVFRTLGFFAACLLCFVLFDAALGTNVVTNAGVQKGTMMSSFLETTPFRRPPALVTPTVQAAQPEQKPIVTVLKYVVVKGDTLGLVCEKIAQNCTDLAQQNGFQPPFSLSVGQEISYIKR